VDVDVAHREPRQLLDPGAKRRRQSGAGRCGSRQVVVEVGAIARVALLAALDRSHDLGARGFDAHQRLGKRLLCRLSALVGARRGVAGWAMVVLDHAGMDSTWRASDGARNTAELLLAVVGVARWHAAVAVPHAHDSAGGVLLGPAVEAEQ
jgi:hypothetical protein